MNTDDGLYHAAPQTRGRIAHESIDNKTASNSKNDILSLPVYSVRFKLMGKIDIYRQKEKFLIERKYRIKQIFQGQIYQLWAQYFCLLEMGYEVDKLYFYEISTNKMIPIALPTEDDVLKFSSFIENFYHYDPTKNITINPNKCKNCIYHPLCDKIEEDVYK